MSGDLLAFLRARLDEDEAVAQGAARTDDGHGGDWLPLHFGAAGFDARVEDHIARYDPARMLAEVAAKRAILAELGEALDFHSRHDEAAALCFSVRQLAAVYAGHPDYNPAWKP